MLLGGLNEKVVKPYFAMSFLNICERISIIFEEKIKDKLA